MRPLWGDLIPCVWGADPLNCTCCQGTVKPVETLVRPEEIEFLLRLLGFWEGLVSLPPPAEPPFDITKRRAIGGVLDAGSRTCRDRLPAGSPKGKRREVNTDPAGRTRQAGRANQSFEPIEPPRQAIRAWLHADDDESPTNTPELWGQTTGTGRKAPEIDLGDGRTLVLEYS